MSEAPTAVQPLSWLRSPAVKLGMALLLILALQIPLFAVSGLISERQDRQEEVLSGIRRSWGPAQAVTGLTLAIPYDWTVPGTQTTPAQRLQGWVQVPASQMGITASLSPETRQRGLFHATVYTAAVQIKGTLTVPKIEIKDVAGAELHWAEAVVALGATDLRGQPVGGTAVLDGKTVPLSVQRANGQCSDAVVAPAGFSAAPPVGTTVAVQAQLNLRGTEAFSILPWGQQIDMAVSAPWQTPSFNGSALPLSFDIGKAGFQANWQIAGDAVGSTWQRGPAPIPSCSSYTDTDAVGVSLLEAVPTYLMVTRAAKYGTLFLALAFLTYFLIEQGTGLRIHIAQYALLGLSVSLFALMLVALAEPLGFTAGYAISTAAIILQASLYTLSVTRRPRLAGVLASVLGLLFAVLYVVLRLESYALLAGTGTVFVVLSVVMAATRNLDWSGQATRP